MTEPDILAILEPLSVLNGFARLPYEEQLGMSECKRAIYAMKNRAIKAAIDLGMATTRIVKVERPCKTCRGTGTYIWQDWHDEDHQEYEDCRRCNATGKVTLYFAETTIAGTRWHTPRPHGAFLGIHPADWIDKAVETDWTPEQPGRMLSRPELFRRLNEAERIIAGGKLFRWENGPWSNVFQYHLMLGEILECFACGKQARATSERGFIYTHEIYRPGLHWKQFICDWRETRCQERAKRFPRQWPANLYREGRGGRWSDELYAWKERCPLPDLAHEPYVEKWMARRGIVQGFVPPGEYGFWRGEFVQVEAIRQEQAFVRGTGWLNIGYDRQELLRVPASDVHGYPRKELTA